ncbi:hypothetical protein NPIL_312081 [Nephila pilipes]|uniref:Uncharacterized protein n=1 Tax=Nephila pilipes TaxID=299642 RepID=A0A8X6NR26_NEPPI|nr:hypothetical protein NPIL_312081 [Nephila pilipes]
MNEVRCVRNLYFARDRNQTIIDFQLIRGFGPVHRSQGHQIRWRLNGAKVRVAPDHERIGVYIAKSIHQVGHEIFAQPVSIVYINAGDSRSDPSFEISRGRWICRRDPFRNPTKKKSCGLKYGDLCGHGKNSFSVADTRPNHYCGYVLQIRFRISVRKCGVANANSLLKM